MSPQITEELIARQSPEAQGIIRALLAEIAALRAELDDLRRQVKGKTPQNSSLPPSTQHPHAKPAQKKPKSNKRRGRRQVVRYVGDAAAAEIVRQELSRLQHHRHLELELHRLIRRAGRMLQEGKQQLAPIVAMADIKFHGLALRRSRNRSEQS